jgi:hypothetical protein
MDVVVCRNRSILNMLGLKVKPGCSVTAQLLFTISKSQCSRPRGRQVLRAAHSPPIIAKIIVRQLAF